jgi:outer membrane receptor for ferrienterochelin and colicins
MPVLLVEACWHENNCKRNRPPTKREVQVIQFGKQTAAFLLCSCAVIPHSPAYAQDAAVTAENNTLEPRIDNGKQIYEAAQFSRFAPQTALDMVRQIPGFSVTQVSGDRGLGEASQNVLINGQRVTGKSNDAETALSRIPVSSVIRIEVADAATFNVSGINGQVLNIVAKEEGLKGNFVWRGETREITGTNLRQGEINLSGKLGKGNFTLGINNNGGFKGGGKGVEFTRDSNGNLLYTRNLDVNNRGDRPRIAGSYALKADNGNILNLNGALEYFRFRRRNELERITPGSADIFELSRGGEDEWNYELGGDYEFGLGKGRLKLIAFRRFENSDFGNEFRSDFTDGTAPTGQRFDRVIDEGETVLRSEYRWKAGKNDWQISLEGAQNYLDADAELFSLVNGNYEPQPLTGASSRVEEKRAQAILSFGRPLSEALSVQTTLGGEYSKISQTGPNGLTRSFIRPKGSVALTWKATPTLTVSSKLQRKVGQLSFFDFLASVDVQNNNNNASNAQLVPPQSWLWENEANWSLGKAGSIKFKLDGELISDLVDQIPISASEEAVGNLPSAKRLRGEINGSFVLDVIGFKGAKLDTVLALQTTSVRDPLLLTNRPISNRGRSYWSVDFRHDIPNTQWAWGLFAEDSGDYGFYRLDYFGRDFRTGPFTLAFIEHKDVLGLKVRATVLNLIGQREGSEEQFYVNRRNGPLDFGRNSDFRYGRFFAVRVSGTF